MTNNSSKEILTQSSVLTSKRLKIAFCVLFLFSFIFIYGKDVSAGCCCNKCVSECGEEWCDTCRKEFNTNSITCEKDGPNIFKRARGTQGCCDEEDCVCTCELCEQKELCEDCGSWQIATRITGGENVCEQATCKATKWGLEKPECKACVDCLKAPTNPRYYNNPLFPLDPYQPEPSKNKDDIYLPVKLDWDDVPGWIGGWRVEDKKVVKKDQSGKMCEISFGAGQDLVECKKDCKNKCWKKMEEEWKGPEKNSTSKWNLCECKTSKERAEKEVEKELEYRNYLPQCISECEAQCVESHKISSNSPCPYNGTIFHCDPPADYVKSYVIEIEGDMRNPEALKKIDILNREIELIEKGLFEAADATRQINQDREEIERIKEEELEVNFFGAALDKSEFIPPYAGFFKSNRTYKWRVRACIKKFDSYDGCCCCGQASCGPWSEWWEFKTNPAPEPALPYDPDWAGEKEDYPASCCIAGKAKDIPKWEIRYLRWVEINDKEFEDEENKEGEICRKWQYNTDDSKTKKEIGSYVERALTEEKKTKPEIKKHCQDNYCINIASRQKKEEEYISQIYCRPYTHNVMLTYRYKDADPDQCHEALKTSGGKCNPKGLYPFPVGWPAEDSPFPFPRFPNEKYNYFTKLTSYSWQADACIEISALKCTNWSQKWRFSVEDFSLKKPDVVSPPNTKESEVGLPLNISWSEIEGAMSYRYEISSLNPGKTFYSSDIVLDFPQLKLDTVYTWKADPCWGYEAEPERCENNWSDTFTFKTTGRPPKPETMEPSSAIPPVTLKWEAVPGAKSYLFTLLPSGVEAGPFIEEGIERILEEPTTKLDWPNLHLNSQYKWKVQTCARNGGGVCGWHSEEKILSVPPLPPPSNLQPANNYKFEVGNDYSISWDKVEGAKFYKYKVTYTKKAEEETRESCQEGKTINPEGELGSKTNTNAVSLFLECLGEYQWQVKSCLGGSCDSDKDGGDWSAVQSFSLASAPPPPAGSSSLVPCGRKSDDPKTLWNEAENCGIKHIFILLENIINFLLWKVAPVLLVVLGAITGGIFYFSKGQPSTIIDVKGLWRATGIGYGIIFLAWTIVDAILLIFGYQVGIFGPWWQFNF